MVAYPNHVLFSYQKNSNYFRNPPLEGLWNSKTVWLFIITRIKKNTRIFFTVCTCFALLCFCTKTSNQYLQVVKECISFPAALKMWKAVSDQILSLLIEDILIIKTVNTLIIYVLCNFVQSCLLKLVTLIQWCTYKPAK